MNNNGWKTQFSELWNRALDDYKKGKTSPDRLFDQEAINFLRSIGANVQEIFDFVEDYVNDGDPSYDLAERITGVRRDYFLQVQGGKASERVIDMSQLPPKPQAVEGIPWLPRLMAKAQAKLKGEMPKDLMYGCGGDRPFARQHGIDLADFLRLAWECGGDSRVLIDYVKGKGQVQRSQ